MILCPPLKATQTRVSAKARPRTPSCLLLHAGNHWHAVRTDVYSLLHAFALPDRQACHVTQCPAATHICAQPPSPHLFLPSTCHPHLLHPIPTCQTLSCSLSSLLPPCWS